MSAQLGACASSVFATRHSGLAQTHKPSGKTFLMGNSDGPIRNTKVHTQLLLHRWVQESQMGRMPQAPLNAEHPMV